MNIPKFSLEHKPIISIVLILFLCVGVFNYFTISQREDPEFKISIALVVTIWPGASAEKVEKLVTNKLEEKFEEIETTEELTSSTREALSVIFVKMDYNCDVDMAWQKVRNKIAEVRSDLPSNIIGPKVVDDFGDVTAMIYSLSSSTAEPKELKLWAKQLRSELKKIKSVGKVELLGEQQEAIYIEGPLDSFTTFKFSPLRASKLLDYQNVNMPAGYTRTDTRKYRLDVTGSFAVDEQLRNAILDVSTKTGAPLKVKDVFKVRRAYKEPPLDMMLTDSEISVGLDIRMNKGYNLVKMGDEVQAIVERFKEKLPPNIKLNLVHNQPRQISNFVDTFMNNLFEGLGIVIIIMMLAMGFRSATLIAFSLPLSIILTFAVMPLFNVDLETISIAAFIIALGMLVDNAIIVTDNIDVYMQKGVKPFDAAWKGTQELILPALSGTLATVLAFMPLLLMSEELGDYIKALPVVVSVSLVASLVLAVTVTPIAAQLFMRPKNGKKQEQDEKPDSAFIRFYSSMMGWCLKYRAIVILLTTGVFVGAIMLLSVVGFSFFPEAERDQFVVDIWLPEGSSLKHTETKARVANKIIKSEKQVKSCVTYIGKGGPRFYITIKPEFNTTNYAQIVCTTDDPLETKNIVERLNVQFRENISGARVYGNKLLMGTPVEAPIALRVTGPDLFIIKKISLQVQEVFKSVNGVLNVRDNVGRESPSLKVNVDSETAAMAGITNTEVALGLLTAYEGFPVTSLRESEEEIPVYMRLIEEERNMGNTLEEISIPSQVTGAKVPLKAFANIETIWSPGVVKRVDRKRSVTALADVQGRLAADVMKEIKPKVAKLQLPKGYAIESVGEEKKRNESFGEMLVIFGLIIALILLMLVIQFNSIVKAIIILASVPLAIVGAIIGLLVSGNSFAFMPFLGVISLAGMVIKNAVVWVEFVQKQVNNGKRLSEAIIDAGRKRFRAIMLTAATTIGGLVPLALFGGALWEGMAFAMIFGLALATILTLVVVPTIYYTVLKRTEN